MIPFRQGPRISTAAGDLVFVTPRGANLPDPPGISVAGRADQDVLRKITEKDLLPALSLALGMALFYQRKLGKDVCNAGERRLSNGPDLRSYNN